MEKEIYLAIEERITEINEALANAQLPLLTGLREYSEEYELEASDHVPQRPYLSIEFGNTPQWTYEDGYRAGKTAVRVHLVQDNYTQLSSNAELKAKALALFDTKELVVQHLHLMPTDGTGNTLAHISTERNGKRGNYRVDVEVFEWNGHQRA